MRCIFVMDIYNSKVVHAVRGERSRYRSINTFSRVVSTPDPIEIIEILAPKEVYVADLNRLSGSGDNLKTIERISSKAITMADIGISTLSDLSLLPEPTTPVLGTETASLDLISDASDLRDIVVSIDMKHRKVISHSGLLDPLELIKEMNDLDLLGIILLELDRVGTSAGVDIEFLSSAVASSDHPVLVGGGVRGLSDVHALEEIGVHGVLVATAVHSRAMPIEMIQL
ncbi:MAG: nickel transporter [Methanothrix sp.]|uniref:Histidine biosynthesis n=1 Tax=Methanothrix thermoacetophila (strain DSM 6194 / JCM 14653 / NBRC 101360 / PT) TaxID=349307 RepID=A0B616_METTP|nr:MULTISPECIES: HisA/HisF-related TIM barrel protein [Methanothrix]ABK14140.1 histidine biosynthesis [Methanothrix thermoacetophila PT]MBC7079760.1 nickel transporter [Methanothrix sp.]NPU87836.1 nickel transporter [Methanothrix sp.]